MNKELFIAQVKVYQNALRSFLLALCGGRTADADDITQDTLYKAYLSIDRYVDKGQFKAWLFKIAFNSFLNHKASQKQYESIEQAKALVGDSSAENRIESQTLYLALSTLPPRERSAISLYYLNGYSIKEIAQITGSSVDAVKKQLSRGRERLKKTINL